MTAFKVIEVKGKKGWESQHGPMVTFSLLLSDPAGEEGVADLNQKPDTPAPTIGQTIDGELVPDPNGKFAPKLKKIQPMGGGGTGGGGRSMATERSIERQTAAKCAAEVIARAEANEYGTADIRVLVDAFAEAIRGGSRE